MRIAVISDTHIPKRASQLPAKLSSELERVSLIIHAGDWQTLEVYNEIGKYAPVVGVTGNVDSPELGKVLKQKEIVQIEGFTVGVVHGHGKGKSTEKRALDAFFGDQLDCLIYGHSHIPVLKETNGTLLFNPGSPTDKRRQKEYSFGILTIGETLEAEHIYFTEKN
ncbi:metallophosphoesterase family protein [Mesobacillus zeae]|uniref:Phosphoesterase n=1 Tax=Mesobacillus zeae TaxID=1917180 RepID=A0A398B9M1_9BACI|nr:metallophosphoesterase [Mesobacillus zeae]RID85538.1 metallophosphoesterase [Mesobacillus zeae]